MFESLMVTRLAAADALQLHTQTPTTSAHTVTVGILEASGHLSHDRLHRLIASALPQLARFRSRLVNKPLGAGQPVWAEIDDYDPTAHIRSATVRTPGGRRELAELIVHLTSGPHDWRRSLWEAWSIDGLADNRWAVAVKMSPVLCDTVRAAASVWGRLLTSGPDDAADTLPPEPGAGSAPSLRELCADSVSEFIENQLIGAWLAAEAVAGVLPPMHRWMRSVGGPPTQRGRAASLNGLVSQTVFNAPLTPRRSIAFSSVPLAHVEAISAAFGGSTENVLLAACSLSLRAWLQQYDVLPVRPLVMRVPLPVQVDTTAEVRRPVVAGHVRVPVHVADPVQMLTNLHTATERMNDSDRRGAEKNDHTADFATVVSLVPPSVMQAAMHMYSSFGLVRWRAPRSDAQLLFAPATASPMYCAGAEVVGVHTAEPLVEGCGLNITVTTHRDAVNLCVCACPDNVPRVNEIASGIEEGVDILLAAAQTSPRGRGLSVVSEMTSHTSKRNIRR